MNKHKAATRLTRIQAAKLLRDTGHQNEYHTGYGKTPQDQPKLKAIFRVEKVTDPGTGSTPKKKQYRFRSIQVATGRTWREAITNAGLGELL